MSGWVPWIFPPDAPPPPEAIEGWSDILSQIVTLERPTSSTSTTGVETSVAFSVLALTRFELQRVTGVLPLRAGGVARLESLVGFAPISLPVEIGDRITTDDGQHLLVDSVAIVHDHHLELRLELDTR